MSQAGKGDSRRPYDKDRWDEGWERTFGEKPCIVDREPTDNPCQVPEGEDDD